LAASRAAAARFARIVIQADLAAFERCSGVLVAAALRALAVLISAVRITVTFAIGATGVTGAVVTGAVVVMTLAGVAWVAVEVLGVAVCFSCLSVSL